MEEMMNFTSPNNDDNCTNGRLEFPNQELQSSSSNMGEIPIPIPSTYCGSMDSIFDELQRENNPYNCTHYHTCNHPGPDLPHTHTCVHIHTKKPDPNEDSNGSSKEHNPHKSARKQEGGNREAVKKYRQKKKAYTMSLADELVKLRAINQELMIKLQNHAMLEAEVSTLKCLLVDIRGRIEGEIGCFPYQNNKSANNNNNVDVYRTIDNIDLPNSSNVPCNAQCDDRVCHLDGVVGLGRGDYNVNSVSK